MTPSQALQSVSQTLYGEWAPSLLAADLGVCARSVRRWAHDPERFPPPERIVGELRTLCLDRVEAIMATVGKLDAL